MALNFPDSPSLGDTYTYGNVNYYYDGIKWVSTTEIMEVIPPTGEFEVRFIDYDGTILKTDYVDSGNAATPPDNPDRTSEGLTFVEWNNSYNNITHDLDVGATYETTDGKTHAFIKVSDLIKQNLVQIILNVSNSLELTVDWGDGSSPTVRQSSGNEYISHNYTVADDYEITIWISSGTGTYGFGGGTTTSIFCEQEPECLQKIYIGENVTNIGDYAFWNNNQLEKIMIPKTITSINQYVCYNCRALKAFIIPNGITVINQYALYYCPSIKYHVLPMSITTINQWSLYYRPSSDKIIVPDNINTIYERGFSSHTSVIKLVLPNKSISYGNAVYYGALILSEEIIVSNFLTIIPLYHFSSYYACPKFTFLGDITTVSAYAFYRCYNCKEFDFTNCSTVPILDHINAFDSIQKTCIIKVPAALETAWKAATNWSTYADYIIGV